MTTSPERLQQHFAAIVEGSDDAIVAKDLNSIIQSWNGGAVRMFGYSAEEAIGRPITMLIPDDRQDEEVEFIARLRRGERIHHYETIRRKKNGELFPISVTISPIRDGDGQVVGASKIARDITIQKQAAQRQHLLLSEMKHRVGNSFAVASGLLSISAREAETVDDLVQAMRGRFMALSAAHTLAVPAPDPAGADAMDRRLRDLVAAVLAPFVNSPPPVVEIEDMAVSAAALTPLALVLYELCTNSVKYGALAQAGGRLTIATERRGDRLLIRWTEDCAIGGIRADGGHQGFGTTMCRSAIEDQLEGRFDRTIGHDGVRALIDVPLERVAAPER